MELQSIMALSGMLGGALSGVETATKIAQNVKDLIGRDDVNTTQMKILVSDLLDRLIKLQTEHVAMQGAAAKAIAEQRNAERFEAEAARYTLERTELGALIYTLKDTEAKGDPAHSICATCYDKQIKSILQPVDHNTLGCNICNGRFLKPDGRDSGIRMTPVRRSRFQDF